ncbi:hypothetical protein IJH89_00585 [Candidatus Saccharibacteria bacterium]|nr:hypothetical protein [Candidatus Saccharibacteria bacterium]
MSKKLIASAGVVASLAVALAPLATFATQASTASDTHTDELVVNVLPSCTFGSASKDTAPYPGGITHDDSTGNYGADGTTANQPETHGPTSWHTTTGASGDEAASGTDEGGHNDDDVASTGYGTLVGEGGVSAANGLANASEHTVHRSMLAGTTTDTFASTTMWVVCNDSEGYSITATANPLTDGAATGAKTIAVRSYSAVQSGYLLKALSSTSAGTAMTIPTAADVAPTTETVIATHAGVSDEAGDSLTVVYGMGISSSQEADTYAGKVLYKLYRGIGSGS